MFKESTQAINPIEELSKSIAVTLQSSGFSVDELDFDELDFSDPMWREDKNVNRLKYLMKENKIAIKEAFDQVIAEVKAGKGSYKGNAVIAKDGVVDVTRESGM